MGKYVIYGPVLTGPGRMEGVVGGVRGGVVLDGVGRGGTPC